MVKKIIGWVLIIFAGALALGTLGTLGSLLHALGTFLLGLLGKVSVYDTARAFGSLVGQAIICTVMYFSWVYGRKWTKKKEVNAKTEESKL